MAMGEIELLVDAEIDLVGFAGGIDGAAEHEPGGADQPKGGHGP
jgi:hypothetical protein